MLLGLLLFAGIALIFYWSGWWPSQSDLQAMLKGDGPWAATVYILILTFLPLLLFPDSLIVLAGGHVFGLLWGTIWTSLGSLIGASLAFYLARFFGQDLIKKYIKRDFLKFTEGETGLWIILILRLIPIFPFKLVSYSAGFSGMRFWPYTVATFVGSLPGIIVYVNLGANLKAPGSLGFFLSIGLAVGLFLISFLLKKLLGKKGFMKEADSSATRGSAATAEASREALLPSDEEQQAMNARWPVSIIIPCYNEAATIERLVAQLADLAGQPEVLFVDGGSSDETVARFTAARAALPAAEQGRFALYTGAKGRAAQMNLGAAKATGQIFLFLHCDSRPDLRMVPAMQKAVIGGAVGGFFHLYFYDGDSTGLRVIASGTDRRAKRDKLIYGDQGIFVTRAVFEKLGGYADMPIMEDWDFSSRLRGEGRIEAIDLPLGTSARRYQAGGTWRTFFAMQKLKKMYLRGDSLAAIAKLYEDIR